HIIISHHTTSFFFNTTAPTSIYTLSLHDALPIFERPPVAGGGLLRQIKIGLLRFINLGCAHVSIIPSYFSLIIHQFLANGKQPRDRKSTRLNSSHDQISYAVFCLKKKKKQKNTPL